MELLQARCCYRSRYPNPQHMQIVSIGVSLDCQTHGTSWSMRESSLALRQTFWVLYYFAIELKMILPSFSIHIALFEEFACIQWFYCTVLISRHHSFCIAIVTQVHRSYSPNKEKYCDAANTLVTTKISSIYQLQYTTNWKLQKTLNQRHYLNKYLIRKTCQETFISTKFQQSAYACLWRHDSKTTKKSQVKTL